MGPHGTTEAEIQQAAERNNCTAVCSAQEDGSSCAESRENQDEGCRVSPFLSVSTYSQFQRGVPSSWHMHGL